MDINTSSQRKKSFSQGLIPKQCLSCQDYVSTSNGFALCQSCQVKWKSLLSSRHVNNTTCGFLKIHWALSYQQEVARFLKSMKRTPFGILDHEKLDFFSCLIDHYADGVKSSDFDLIVKVPSHPVRRYFQTELNELIAQLLSKKLGKPYCSSLIRRALFHYNSYLPQKSLSWQERRQFDRYFSFQVNPSLKGCIQNKRILLVDDVCVTGSSLNFCSLLLRKAGALSSRAFVFAKT